MPNIIKNVFRAFFDSLYPHKKIRELGAGLIEVVYKT